jgi:transcriptional regulator with GAF, ATPase, and Fis domain
LRERAGDIPCAGLGFAQRYAQRIGRPVAPLTAEDARRLQGYAWPGNVRELQNVIERAVITAVGNRLNLDRALPEAGPVAREAAPVAAVDAAPIRTLKEMEELERNNLRRALEAAQWRISGEHGAAAMLGMNPSTLRSRMKALGVQPPK